MAEALDECSLVDTVDQGKVGRMGLDFAAVRAEIDPIDGWREDVAGFQPRLDVETEVECEMIEVLASTPREGLSIAARGKEG